jgi:hypothetical protein
MEGRLSLHTLVSHGAEKIERVGAGAQVRHIVVAGPWGAEPVPAIGLGFDDLGYHAAAFLSSRSSSGSRVMMV